MGADRDSPLTILARKLLRGPPSLSYLTSWFESDKGFLRFLDLVREYVPEYEREILAEAITEGRITAFVSHFSDRYFPLEEGLEEYQHLTTGIPVIVQGMSYEDYHEMPGYWREGYCLMTYLLESPWENEARIALGEECAEQVPAELLQQVPSGGFSLTAVPELTRGSTYEALGHWANILCHCTGNFFLDTDYEDLGYGYPLEWDRQTVEELTRQWQQAERIQQMVLELAQWLEDDPSQHFEEIINFLEERMNAEQ
jgi:hypothetical protein